MIMREGSCREPDFERRGVNLTLISSHLQIRSHREDLQSRQIEHPPHIQIQHLLTTPVWRRLKRASPSSSRIAHQDVQLSLAVLHLLNQFLDILCFCYVCSYADGFAFDVGELVKARDGLVNALCAAVLARRDYDGAGACKEERGCGVEAEATRSCDRYRSALELEGIVGLG